MRAALEAVGFQTAELLAAMAQDTSLTFDALKVDGGMVANPWLLQFLADILQLEVIHPRISETTALGVAMLAGRSVGLFGKVNKISTYNGYSAVIRTEMVETETIFQINNWKNALKSTIYHSDG